ncbi:MAG: hypothetical protein FJ088_08975 [Deltaproteobacteria bacterium]|nr:hypothetical protein [Deltaproteobacteria bacterium]
MNSEGAGFFRCKPEAQGILFRVVSDGCDPAFQFTEEITAEPLKAVFNKFGESGGGFSAELKSIYDSGELFCAVFKGDRFKTLRFVQLRSHAGRLDFQPDGAGLFHIACSFSAAVDPRLSVRAAFAKDSYGTLHTPATLPVLAALKAPPGSGLVSLNTYQDDLNRVDMQKKRIKTFSVAGIIVITTAVFAAVLVWIRRSARKVQEDFSRVSEGDESIAAPHSFLFILLLAGFMALDVALLIYLLLM